MLAVSAVIRTSGSEIKTSSSWYFEYEHRKQNVYNEQDSVRLTSPAVALFGMFIDLNLFQLAECALIFGSIVVNVAVRREVERKPEAEQSKCD